MGNRVGSPPPSAGDGGEEQSEEHTDEEQDGEDETVQTGIAGAVAGAAAAAAGAAGAAAGVGSLPVDGEVPEKDGEDDDESSPDDDGDEDGEDDSEVPEDPPVEPDQLTGDDRFEPSEPVEKPVESDGEEAPEDENDLDDEDENSRFVYGDVVYDRDSIDEDEVEEEDTKLSVVVNLPDASIAEWECDDDETVADRDPHYPPTDDVVVVVDREVLDDVAPAWDERESEILIEELEAVGVEYTAYPSLRLDLYEPSHIRCSSLS